MNQPFLDEPNCEALPDTERSESEGDRGDVAESLIETSR